YHPAMLLGLLIYGYATGVFSSRKIERATYDSVAFRYIAANQHPDHDTLATFRRRFLPEIEGLFVAVLQLAGQMGVLKLGTVALDGTKMPANASRHSALSWGHANKIEAQLRQEVAELLALAEQADAADLPDELSIPAELERRETRLAAIAAAKAEIEARAAARFAEEQAEYEAKLTAREEKMRRTGKKPGGKPPAPPVAGPRDKDQVNLTDPDSRIMKTQQGFDQCYNAQAAVDTETMLVVGQAVTQAGNDYGQVGSMLERLTELPAPLGRIDHLLADSGYCSEDNIELACTAEIEPLFALGREAHHRPWRERCAAPPPLDPDASPLERMAHRLKTQEGRALYALRKQTVEPVFGIIKSVMDFRQFLLRGLDKASGEWSLVTLSWNIKRMFALQPA
ncbi:MAG: IS1182 family transposase, partial [Xanthomonadales bacterium]|nr:IS1182 family transposase [Xanthomonadales bacterium]